jgi:uncharacterized protein YebE (UPF0316 family)
MGSDVYVLVLALVTSDRTTDSGAIAAAVEYDIEVIRSMHISSEGGGTK